MSEKDSTLASCRTEIIVPTLATTNRASQLLRAIESIASQGARALVVVNGERYDDSLVSQLRRRQDIRLLSIAEPGLPNAIHMGRCAIKADYFGILDDDDYLLGNSIAVRASYLDSNSDIDVVITNGLREEWGDQPQLFKEVADLERIATDPMAALLHANWLTPCGALYRTSTVPDSVFLNLTKYAEWTDVAFRLIDDYRIKFLFQETFVQSDSPGSLSKDSGQAHYLLKLHEGFVAKVKTRQQRRLLDIRICELNHAIAEFEMNDGNRAGAMMHHLRSMFLAPSIGIPRYVLFTRKLFRKSTNSSSA